MITLVLGGMKSGKSDHALDLFLKAPQPGLFVPTGKALDTGFRRQILRHREERPASIPVREVECDLPRTLGEAKKNFASILVDSLDFWLFSVMEANTGEDSVRDLDRILENWTGCELFIVSGETGLGPIPASAHVMAFVERLGRLNRMVAAHAREVRLVAAGLPMVLKSAETRDEGKTED